MSKLSYPCGEKKESSCPLCEIGLKPKEMVHIRLMNTTKVLVIERDRLNKLLGSAARQPIKP